MSVDPIHLEQAVRERYSQGAQEREETLCCPVEYDARYLKILPQEILDRDYGCGDPSRYVRPGDVVLDLGSGAGKICYIAAQVAGPTGRVIGVDMNEEMLALARKHQGAIAARLGYDNVRFCKGRIQDLALNLEEAEDYLRKHPLGSAAALDAFERRAARWRAERPLIADASVDLVISNCVLNLVREDHKQQLFAELFRVLRRGGRVAISDIVSDESVPEAMKRDPELWSGCISGALREDEFLKAFEAVGFYGIEIAERSETPWRVVEGIEFRSVTLTAHKGKEGPCWEGNQAVIYKGPFHTVCDDDGHRFVRGERVAVCEKTYEILTREPYAGQFTGIEPRVPIAEAGRQPFDCKGYSLRHPRQSKGEGYRETTEAEGSCCAPALPDAGEKEPCC